jgi:hypothetical protein
MQSSMQYNSRFTWNSYLLSEYSTRLSPQWTLPIVHGYFNQAWYLLCPASGFWSADQRCAA